MKRAIGSRLDLVIEDNTRCFSEFRVRASVRARSCACVGLKREQAREGGSEKVRDESVIKWEAVARIGGSVCTNEI